MGSTGKCSGRLRECRRMVCAPCQIGLPVNQSTRHILRGFRLPKVRKIFARQGTKLRLDAAHKPLLIRVN